MARKIKTTQPKAKQLSRIRPSRPGHEQEARYAIGTYFFEVYSVFGTHQDGQFKAIVTGYVYDNNGGLLAEAKFRSEGFYAEAIEYWDKYSNRYMTSCDVSLAELGGMPYAIVNHIQAFEAQARSVYPNAEELAAELAKGEFEGIFAERGARDAFANRLVEELVAKLEEELRSDFEK